MSARHAYGEWLRSLLIAVIVVAALCAVAPFATDYVLHVLITSLY